MIQEEKQQFQQYIELCSDENQSLNKSDEIKQLQVIEKQKGSIFKQKRKYRKRLIWIPLIMKNVLKADTEPIFIFSLFKMMKKYDTEEIEKYQDYGIQDAGIGYFDSIKFDRVNQSIDVSLTTFFYGQADLNGLIQLYKSYQNQQYYNLALVLQEFQTFINIAQNFLINLTKQNSKQIKNIDEDFYKFECTVKEWANNNLENDIYEIVIGHLDLKGTPQFKKIIFSKNLLLLLGGELQETYNEISLQRNLDFLTNFVRRRQNINGEFELNRTIKFLQTIVNKKIDYEMDDEIQTLDGFTIPVKKTTHSYFYDPQTGEISKQYSFYGFSLTKYNLEPYWIKYLIDKRSSQNNMNQQNQINKLSMQQQAMMQNLEYICQKEYFLEKFNYNQPQQTLIN